MVGKLEGSSRLLGSTVHKGKMESRKNEIHLKSCDLSDVDKVCVGDFRDQ